MKAPTSIIPDQEMCERESRKIAPGSLVYKINSVDSGGYKQCYIWEFMTALHDTEGKGGKKFSKNVF